MTEQRWELYIDESGNFSDPNDEVVVAGLLVHTEKAGLDGREIAQAIHTTLPHIPLPLHASFLKRPSYGIFCYASAQQPKTAHHTRQLDPKRIKTYEQALQILGKKAQKTLTQMTDTLRRGRSLSAYYNELHSWETQLKPHPDLYKQLKHDQELDLAHIARIIRDLNETTDANHALLLFAAEETRASAVQPKQDRYLLLLLALIERAYRVLHIRTQGHFRLEIKVATRDVYYAPFNINIRLSNPIFKELEAHLRAWLGAFTSSTDHGVPKSPECPFSFHPPMRYDLEIPTALALADIFSNTAYSTLRNGLKKHKQHLSLALWKTAIAQLIGQWPLSSLPPHSPAGLSPRSHFAASPHIADALRQAIHTEHTTQTFEQDPRTQNIRLWAKEQALSWLP
ncbi:hypothetical protein L6R29_24050 [Myxococcota bacterium]|nr:hypothetical protein [Myxococcota bacterium]